MSRRPVLMLRKGGNTRIHSLILTRSGWLSRRRHSNVYSLAAAPLLLASAEVAAAEAAVMEARAQVRTIRNRGCDGAAGCAFCGEDWIYPPCRSSCRMVQCTIWRMGS